MSRSGKMKCAAFGPWDSLEVFNTVAVGHRAASPGLSNSPLYTAVRPPHALGRRDENRIGSRSVHFDFDSTKPQLVRKIEFQTGLPLRLQLSKLFPFQC